MKRLCVWVAAALTSGAAGAADLTEFEPAPAMAPMPAAYDWSGFYAGLHGGYGWGDVDADFDIGTSFDDEPDGWIAGGQVGFNFQRNWFVGGLEADIAWSDIDGATPCPNTLYNCTTDVDWIGSARLRAGAALDRFLVYATGGVGFASVEYDAIRVATGASFGGGDDETQIGWTAGAGAEVAVTSRFSVKAEYLYYDLGEGDLTASSFGGPGGAELTIHTAKIGVNLHF